MESIIIIDKFISADPLNKKIGNTKINKTGTLISKVLDLFIILVSIVFIFN